MNSHPTARYATARWRSVVWRVLAAAALVTMVVALAKRQSPQGTTDLTMSDTRPTLSDGNPTSTTTKRLTDGALAVPRQRSRTEPRLATEPSAPYRAGQTVRFRAPLTIVADYSNDLPLLCFDWGENEACDPAAWGRKEGGRRDGDDAVRAGTLPARILDTRKLNPLGAGDTINLPVLGLAGIPTTSVGAVVLNLTVTGPRAAGYLTTWPTGDTKPDASSVNFAAGQTVANLVVAKSAPTERFRSGTATTRPRCR